MLSEAERTEIEAQVGHYPDRQSLCIDAMLIVQEHRGWVSDESISDIADLLGLSPADVDGVATFYNLIYRRPVGRHVIHVCDSVSCWIMGYETVLEHLSRRLGIGCGETTPDGRVTLLPIVCLGACDHAPAMMVDRTLFDDLDPQKIDAILEGLA
jgi:NADH-quinone oxidoreductase subunit E